MSILDKFFSLPKKSKIELLLYPIFLLYRMPIAWTRSLWEARILLNGQWGRYMGFDPKNAINSLFYRTQWLNIDRFGRKGKSFVIGTGNYSLRNWFHLSLPASYFFANAGAVTTLVSTLFWVFSHLFWLEYAENKYWIAAVVLILFFSSTAYAMAFARQNYQMLGWMWLPLAMYFSNESAYIPAAFAWFAAGLGGITPIFFSIPITIAIALSNQDPRLILVIFPVLLFKAFVIISSLKAEGFSSTVFNMLKLIGATQKEIRYKRGMNRVGFATIYLFFLYFLGALLISLITGKFALLPFLGALLYLINQRFFRVADEESMIVIAMSLFACEIISTESNPILLIVFWFASNPMGYLLSIQQLNSDDNLGGGIIINPPFNHFPLEKGVETFLESVRSNQKVYFAFEDPIGKYANIFDGYRVIHELPLFVASKKEIHLFPDWWAVAETNYHGAPNCWGRNTKEVIANCKNWGASYAIIYQESGSTLSQQWIEDFELISEFDWASYKEMLRGVNLLSEENSLPKWFLLRLR